MNPKLDGTLALVRLEFREELIRMGMSNKIC